VKQTHRKVCDNRQTVPNVNYTRSVKNEERAVQLECCLYSLYWPISVVL